MKVRDRIKILEEEINHHAAQLTPDNLDEIGDEIGWCFSALRDLGAYQSIANFLAEWFGEIEVLAGPIQLR